MDSKRQKCRPSRQRERFLLVFIRDFHKRTAGGYQRLQGTEPNVQVISWYFFRKNTTTDDVLCFLHEETTFWNLVHDVLKPKPP